MRIGLISFISGLLAQSRIRRNGYAILHKDRDTLEYLSKDGKTIDVYVELTTNPRGKCLYLNSISRWNPPHQTETIPTQEKQLIAERIVAHCKKLGTVTTIGKLTE